jgi:hypothetical protein
MLTEKLKTTTMYSNDRIQTDLRRPVRWIWDGILALGAITLLTAPEKTGKSTLLSLLLDRRRQGGSLLGRDVQAGGTLLCSEENQTIWAARQPPLDFGPELIFVEPVHTRGSRRRIWHNFVTDLCEFEEGEYDLLVIDSVFNFMPAAPNNPKAVRWALQELRDFGDSHGAILLLHQSPVTRNRRKSHGPLAAFADILVDMQIPKGDPSTRHRTFTAVGRYPGVLPTVTADLNPEGTDYLVVPSPAPGAGAAPGGGLLTSPPPALGAGLPTSPLLQTILQILTAAPQPLTRLEILTRWPENQTPPHRDSLTRVLSRGCDLKQVTRIGPGTKFDPFRYSAI